MNARGFIRALVRECMYGNSIRQFPGLWEWIAEQIAKKILVMPDVALEEVSKEAPECSQWLEENNINV